MNTEFDSTADRVVIIGGGPGGYEAALVAAQLGADVMLIEQNRCGGSAVLTDVVPSKSLIATAEMMDEIERSDGLGIRIANTEDTEAVARRVTADHNEPKVPPLVIVNVPPVMSSMPSLPSRALAA